MPYPPRRNRDTIRTIQSQEFFSILYLHRNLIEEGKGNCDLGFGADSVDSVCFSTDSPRNKA